MRYSRISGLLVALALSASANVKVPQLTRFHEIVNPAIRMDFCMVALMSNKTSPKQLTWKVDGKFRTAETETVYDGPEVITTWLDRLGGLEIESRGRLGLSTFLRWGIKTTNFAQDMILNAYSLIKSRRWMGLERSKNKSATDVLNDVQYFIPSPGEPVSGGVQANFNTNETAGFDPKMLEALENLTRENTSRRKVINRFLLRSLGSEIGLLFRSLVNPQQLLLIGDKELMMDVEVRYERRDLDHKVIVHSTFRVPNSN